MEFKTKKEAEERAIEIINRMRHPENWTIKLRKHPSIETNKIAYSFYLKNGVATLYFTKVNEKEIYDCLISDDLQFDECGSTLWTTDRIFSDPNNAFEFELNSARQKIDEINQCISSIK